MPGKNHPGGGGVRERGEPKINQAPFRGKIFVEIQPKIFSSSVRSGIFRSPSDDVAPDGAWDFYETKSYKYAAPTALCDRCVEVVKQFKA